MVYGVKERVMEGGISSVSKKGEGSGLGARGWVVLEVNKSYTYKMYAVSIWGDWTPKINPMMLVEARGWDQVILQIRQNKVLAKGIFLIIAKHTV